MTDPATFLQGQMDHLLQDISESLKQPCHLERRLESQPTVFHSFKINGWSLTLFTTASGQEHHLGVRDMGLGHSSMS